MHNTNNIVHNNLYIPSQIFDLFRCMQNTLFTNRQWLKKKFLTQMKNHPFPERALIKMCKFIESAKVDLQSLLPFIFTAHRDEFYWMKNLPKKMEEFVYKSNSAGIDFMTLKENEIIMKDVGVDATLVNINPDEEMEHAADAMWRTDDYIYYVNQAIHTFCASLRTVTEKKRGAYGATNFLLRYAVPVSKFKYYI